MAQRAAGTLSLPWPTSVQRPSKSVALDPVILAVTLILAMVGLVMVFSASAVVAGNRFHDPWYFLKRQLAWLAVGLVLMHVASKIDYAIWKKAAIPLLFVTTVMLVLVLVPSLGSAAKGARRWLRLGPVNLQPAEMVKLVAVIYIASFLTNKGDKLTLFARGLLPPLMVLAMLSGLVLLEPDLGTVVVMGLVVVTLLFLGGARVKHLALLALIALPAVAILILGSPYRRQRMLTFLSPWKDASDAGFQITQSFLAFGSGGLFGVGLGEGKQKLFFLPEAHTDFVLALVGEELGLMGSATIILLFGLFVVKGFQIARRARHPFGRHLATGITLLIGMQALVNAAVVTGLLPTKGLTLPFVSYGGSSLVASLFGVGILLNISRDRHGGRESEPQRSGRVSRAAQG
ncbi:MAG: putative lipid II flippase FtsW [Nitrospiraceae bacterium]|nr:putative lipid II flippase FtsW [Nitrospiraceae bacterium]